MAGESYLYTDVFGNPTRRVVKYPNKEFRQFHPEEDANGKIEWKPGAKGPGEPYMLPEILDAIGRGETVYWVEGEKDANNLSAYGVAATTIPNGSSAPWADQWLLDIPIGSKFVVVADYDRPGFKHAKKIAEGLRAGRMVVVDVVRSAVGEFVEKGGKDATDHLEADLTVDEMVSCEHELEQRLKSTNPPPKRNHLRDASFDWGKWALQFQEENDTGRNETAMHLVCQLRDNDVEKEEAWRWVERFWEALGEPDDFPLSECKTVFDKNFFTPKRPAWGEDEEVEEDPLPEYLPPGYKKPSLYRLLEGRLFKHLPATGKRPARDELVANCPVWITARSRDSEDRMFVEIRWRDQKALVERRKIRTNSLGELSSLQDFPVFEGEDGNKGKLMRWFDQLEDANRELLPIGKVIDQIGWQPNGEFLCEPESFTTNVHDELQYWVSRLGKGGSLDGWFDMYNTFDHRLIQFCIAAGLSAPLLEILDEPSPFVVAIEGPTSKGKSTMLRVVASLWGPPGKGGKKGYVFSWNNPQGYIEGKGGRLNGMPLLMDELGSANNELVARIIYDATEGQTRGRADRNIANKTHEGVEWRTVLMTAGELPINEGNARGGTRARVVTIPDFDLGYNGETLRQLNNMIDENFGWVGPAFMREVLGLDREWLNKRYDAHVNRWQERCNWDSEGSAIIQRRCQPYAVISLAAELMGKVVDIPSVLFEDPDWWVGLISARGREESDDLALGCGQIILHEAIGQRREKLWHTGWEVEYTKTGTKYGGGAPRRDLWGWWEDDMDAPVFIPTQLYEVCKKHGFNFKEHSAEMKRRGWLATDNHPSTATQKLIRHSVVLGSRVSAKCYVFTKKFVEDVARS